MRLFLQLECKSLVKVYCAALIHESVASAEPCMGHFLLQSFQTVEQAPCIFRHPVATALSLLSSAFAPAKSRACERGPKSK